MKVLLSINPEHVEKILNGSKKFEFRKGMFKNPEVKSVIIYSTMPVGRIVAEFVIDGVIADEPSEVWKKTSKYAGISKSYFDSYFKNKDRAFAIKIGPVEVYDKPRLLSSLGENISAPQSFRYV